MMKTRIGYKPQPRQAQPSGNAAPRSSATQESFAKAIGVSVKTLRNWEQRRRQPTGPARVLLACIARNPWLVFDAIGPRGLDGAPHATRAAK
jgi:hypothetical protein